MIVSTVILPVIFLLGSSILEAINVAALRMEQSHENKKYTKPKSYSLFLKTVTKLFPNDRLHWIHDFLSRTKTITTLAYALSSTLFLVCNHFFSNFLYFTKDGTLMTLAWFLLAFAVIGGVFLLFQLLFRIIAAKSPLAALKLFSFIGTIYISFLFPLVWPLLFCEQKVFPHKGLLEPHLASEKLKLRLLELLKEFELQKILDPKDKKLVESIAHFGSLVSREIMVPRVDVLCITDTTTIYEALKLFIDRGFSRIPVYADTMDQIIGVLLYKDVMKYCFNVLDKDIQSIKKTPIKSLISPIVFSPENKKIQDLFQEMRMQKIHSAIVVDEYGCTEGLVTIEDILEELIGTEIFDEHDIEEKEARFTPTEDKSWIVEGKMSIVDIERKIGITIPHNIEYETIAGYISSQMGMIPAPGTIIHGDQFKIQVLASDKRQILKVKITPQEKPPEESE